MYASVGVDGAVGADARDAAVVEVGPEVRVEVGSEAVSEGPQAASARALILMRQIVILFKKLSLCMVAPMRGAVFLFAPFRDDY